MTQAIEGHPSGSPPAALVTGASYGVGAAIALALARVGYDVALTATKRANLTATLEALAPLGRRISAHEMMLEDEAGCDRAFEAAVAEHPGLELLVNNAGVNLRRAAIDVTRAEWDRVMAANVTGAFQLSQRLARRLIAENRPGSILNIASTHGLAGAAERSTYGISKGAMLQMTRMLAVEWAPLGIRVNAIAPGRMITASPSRAGTGSDSAYMAAMLGRIPLGRLATAEEVADAVVYLAGPQAGSITGHTMVIDGGLTAQ